MPARRPAPPAWLPTPRQRLVLGAHVQHGPKEAAHRLEISESAVNDTLDRMRRHARVETTDQLIYLGATAGWLRIPALDRRTIRARRDYPKPQVAPGA